MSAASEVIENPATSARISAPRARAWSRVRAGDGDQRARGVGAGPAFLPGQPAHPVGEAAGVVVRADDHAGPQVRGPAGEVLVRLRTGTAQEPILRLGGEFQLDGELAERLASVEGIANVALTARRGPGHLRLVA